MNPTDPLAQLRDIHLPSGAGWWPPAPGWWLVATLLLLTLTGLALFLYRRYRNNQWRREARRQLRQLAQSQHPTADWFGQLNALLKRVARQRFPERRPQSLTGPDWASFLLTTAPASQADQQAQVRAMVEASWQPHPTLDTESALQFARRWLEAQP
ncbi:DUF4381 family protein [Marinobacter oulmenensis]|uniref:DUF4381 domain-containing protein n=1 Tax=Marinobacter oulmenensis TaxID=643747 RepID=A0A840U7X4_9GAMM|nr:hypothetical protein [Marinobacter oulmenensis]